MGRGQGSDMTDNVAASRSTAKAVTDMSVKELASEIKAILNRLEADTEWNKFTWTDMSGETRNQTHFHGATAWASSGRVGVRYVSYQGEGFLERGQAEDYLTWLRAGNKGSHYSANNAIRRRKRAQEADESEVAYRAGGRFGFGTEVYRAVHIPDDAPESRSADDVKEGDRVYVNGGWRKIDSKKLYAPPMPEDIQGLEAEIRDLTLRGEYAEVAEKAHQLSGLAEQLANKRELEVHLQMGKTKIIFTPEAMLGVKPAKS
jgi:hypothetical protein